MTPNENITLDHAKGLALLTFVFASLWQGLSGSGLLKGIDPLWVSLVSSACTIIAVPLICLAYGVSSGLEMPAWRGLDVCRQRFGDLIYPFVVWSLIVGLFEVLGSGARTRTTSFSDLYDIPWNPHGVFWLPYTLYLSIGLTALMNLAVGMRYTKLVIVPVGLVMLGLFPWAPHVLTAREVSMCFVFFALGVLIADKLPVRRASLLAMCMATALLLGLVYFGHTQMDGATRSVRAVTPNASLLALSVLASSMWLAYSLPRKASGWLAVLGRHFMPIYLAHLLFVVAARLVLGKVLHVQSVPVYVVVCMLTGVIGPLMLLNWGRHTVLRYLFEPPAILGGQGTTKSAWSRS